MCSIYTSFPETAEAMLYYQCTIIIATTTNHTIRTLSKSSLFMIHGIYFACAHCLTHYNDKQEQYLRLQQIITSVLVIHINCCPAAKPDIASTWWAFYFMMSGYEWLKRLTILAIASYGSDQLIGSFLANIEPSVKSMYFLFGLLLRSNTDYSTFALHTTSTFRQFFNIWNWDCKTTQIICIAFSQLHYKNGLCNVQIQIQKMDRIWCFRHGGDATNVTSAVLVVHREKRSSAHQRSTTLTASAGQFPVWNKSCHRREETLYSRWLSLSTTQPWRIGLPPKSILVSRALQRVLPCPRS